MGRANSLLAIRIALRQSHNRRSSGPLLATIVACALTFFHSLVFAQSANDRNKLLTLWAGTLPIILAAPHGGRHPIPGVPARKGVGVADFTVGRDNNTDELAHAVALKLGDKLGAKPFLVIAQFERKFLDANRPAAGAYESPLAKPFYDAYHRAVEDFAEKVRTEWGGGLLLDIHGQGTAVDTIFRGTHNGQTVAALHERFGKDALTGPKSIFGQLASKGYKILPDPAGSERESRYGGGYTTQTYGSHRGTKIDAIQLEIGPHLRAKANLDRTANDIAQAIEIFSREYLPIVKRANGTQALP